MFCCKDYTLFMNGKNIARDLINYWSPEIAVIEPDGIIAHFSRYYFRMDGSLSFTGSTRSCKRVSKRIHKNYRIPPPLAEQERIVGILDEAFEGIAAATAQAEKNLHNARELFQSVLQSTFSQNETGKRTTIGNDMQGVQIPQRTKRLLEWFQAVSLYFRF